MSDKIDARMAQHQSASKLAWNIGARMRTQSDCASQLADVIVYAVHTLAQYGEVESEKDRASIVAGVRDELLRALTKVAERSA